jgi:predicted nucleic acid-binding protein
MIVISNSSPLIALGKIQRLDILKCVFKKIYIPKVVYQEVIIDDSPEKEALLQGVNDFIEVIEPKTTHSFKRMIDSGEKEVLNLAIEINADMLIIDDRKARKEAQELGFKTFLTSTIIKRAEQQKLITSYMDIKRQLRELNIFLPEYTF